MEEGLGDVTIRLEELFLRFRGFWHVSDGARMTFMHLESENTSVSFQTYGRCMKFFEALLSTFLFWHPIDKSSSLLLIRGSHSAGTSAVDQPGDMNPVVFSLLLGIQEMRLCNLQLKFATRYQKIVFTDCEKEWLKSKVEKPTFERMHVLFSFRVGGLGPVDPLCRAYPTVSICHAWHHAPVLDTTHCNGCKSTGSIRACPCSPIEHA